MTYVVQFYKWPTNVLTEEFKTKSQAKRWVKVLKANHYILKGNITARAA